MIPVALLGGSAGLRINTTQPASHSSATGSYTTVSARSVFSTIDAGQTASYDVTYDTGCGAAVATYGKLPVWLNLHGYSTSAGDFSTSERQQQASQRYFVVTPETRGFSPNAGTPDDGCRELYDLLDILADVNATYGAVADVTRLDVLGESGGAARTYQLLTKCPGFIRAACALFGFGDYGYSGSTSHSFWAFDSAIQATMEARDGTRGASPSAAQLQPYFARLITTSISAAMNLTTSKVISLWDAFDPTVGVALHRDMITALATVGVSQHYEQESNSSTGPHPWWQHGPAATYPDNLLAEYALQKHATDPVPRRRTAGTCDVRGLLVYGNGTTRDFEVWLDASGTTNPRTNGTGGKAHTASLTFDTVAKTYTLTALDGDCHALVRVAGVNQERDITNGVASTFSF